MPPKPWTPDHDIQLRELHATGKSLHAIAKEMGRAKSTVSKAAERLGLSWDRSRVAKATQAKVLDARARRAALELRYLEEADRLLDEMRQPVEYIDHGGKDYIEVRWTQPEPSIQDKQRLMQSSGMALDRALKISVHDNSGTRDLPAVEAWLHHLTGGGDPGAR